jgi:regulator of sirC expression with transglutaminase-like and TPR domain
MGEHEKALAEYNRALGLEPDFPNALYGRGQIFYQLGYVEPAVTDFERFLALSEDKTLCKEAEQYLEQLKEKKP